jgi:hypothetical protein
VLDINKLIFRESSKNWTTPYQLGSDDIKEALKMVREKIKRMLLDNI